jgi:hypothetical protein
VACARPPAWAQASMRLPAPRSGAGMAEGATVGPVTVEGSVMAASVRPPALARASTQRPAPRSGGCGRGKGEERYRVKATAMEVAMCWQLRASGGRGKGDGTWARRPRDVGTSAGERGWGHP